MAPSTDSRDDCVSVYSCSSSHFDDADVDKVATPFEEAINEDEFEDKLMAAMDSTFLKAAKSRVSALESIRAAFSSRYVADFITERRCSISEILERCIKKGKGEEQGSAALLAALVCISLGPSEETDALFADLESQMITVLMDKSVSTTVRSRFALALGLCSFIAGVEVENVTHIMDCLHSLFSCSYHKGNGVPPNFGPEATALHSAALQSWALLLTVQTSSRVVSLADKHLHNLIQLLDSNDVELRIAAGETIAVMCEICREFRQDLFEDSLLFDKLRLLATDSQKFRAKKDRRKQRSSFRDVLKYIEDEETSSMSVRFGREKMFIDTWCRRVQYDAFCQVLGSGMNLHLSQNFLLREIFDLGPPLPIDIPVQKVRKSERKMENTATSKARARSRGKLRDKRADVLS
ncbi:interferon-related developmental regulator 1 [Brevipalpus obovatus]|uniref:interferon-related developmental regulator 1 n=1 Tax=Brevipalpus obovatus TaxID=246614 RepID=UPI003D9EA195